jgi:hypothetical protein
MTIKRSYFHLLFGSLGVALLLANCTVKEDTDQSCEKGDKVNGCDCPGNATGHQECGKDGTFGACICPGSGTAGSSSGGSSDEGGTDGGGSAGTTTGGTGGSSGGTGGTGGTSEAGAGVGGASEGGAGGEPAFAFANCDECVATLCETQFNACADSEECLDQYAAVSGCVEEERKKALVKRDLVRGCGVTLGASSDASLAADWAPPQMNPLTTDLINCMASSLEVDPPNGDWANDMETNFPEGVPAPWPEDSCAKLACTSKVAP